jgi:hypothetical protein
MTVSYYQALSDGNLRPTEAVPGQLAWNPSDDIVRSGSGNQPVLSYRIRGDSDATDRNVKVQVNGNNIWAPEHISGQAPMTITEVVNWSCNIRTGTNDITFEVEHGGSGNPIVSDVIIWYKRTE